MALLYPLFGKDLIILLKPLSKPPSWRFLVSHPAHFIACGFGSGLAPVAPGTAGTLLAWLLFFPLQRAMPTTALLIFIVAAFLVGIPLVHKTGKDLGVLDHGSIVWDEIVPFWLALYFCPAGFFWQLAAFVLFRFLDVFKPQPARFFDQKVKNGLGVMCDDLVVSLYTIIALLVIERYVIFPGASL